MMALGAAFFRPPRQRAAPRPRLFTDDWRLSGKLCKPICSPLACREVWSAWTAHAMSSTPPSRPRTRLPRGRATRLAALKPARSSRLGPQDPSALLGARHPLVHTLHALGVVARQTLAVAVALATCAVFAAGGATWALAGGFITVHVLLALVAIAAGLRGRARRQALNLILEGRERLALAAVERERRRLLNPRTRRRLATELTGFLEGALLARGVPVASPALLADPSVVRENASDVSAFAALVRAAPASARGVAVVECLLRRRSSALYGKEAQPLGEELRRARYLLQRKPRT